MATEYSKRDFLLSKLDDIDEINYDGLSDFESLYLLTELKKTKKLISNSFE